MKNKVKDFLGVALVTLTAVLGIFITTTPVVKADTVGVTVKVVPVKGKNIFGWKEDYPVVKSRIILNGASSGNRGSMESGDSRYFTVNVPRSGGNRAVMIEGILSNGARFNKTKNVWIDGNRTQTIYIAVN